MQESGWRALRLGLRALWRAYWEEDLPDSARALVYMTLLTLVPLLAVAFALLSGFGLEGVIEPWLHNLFAPMGEAGGQVVEHLIRFVGQTRAGSLGAAGVVFLFVSVLGLAYNIEAILNRIWSVENERPLPVRFAAHTSIVLLAPLLLGALMSTLFNLQHAAWLQGYVHLPWVAGAVRLFTGLVPLVLTFLVLAALYLWIPNCRVRYGAALCGAAFFLALWYPVSALFSLFIATSGNYSIIYSGFASVIILLVWLNFLWLLFLLGAKVSVLVQRPHERLPDAQSDWQGDEAFATAVALVSAIFAAFRNGDTPPDVETLAAQVRTSPARAGQLLKRLHRAGLLAKTTQKPPRYLPDKAVKHYTLLDIYRALTPQDIPLALPENSPYPAVHARYLQMLEATVLIEK